MKHSNPHKYYGRWLPWTTGTLAFAGLTGTLFALSEVLENDTDGDGGTEFAVTQDSGAAFTGSDWVLSRARQANPVAFQSGSKLKLVPTFRLPDSTEPTRIQALVTLGNSTNTYTLAWSERGNGIEIPAPVPAGTVGYFENASEGDYINNTTFECDILMDLEGVAKQNNSNPKSSFKNHVFVYRKGCIYDSSYGAKSERFSDPNVAVKAWAQSWIVGFQHARLRRAYKLIDERVITRPACRLYDDGSLKITTIR